MTVDLENTIRRELGHINEQMTAFKGRDSSRVLQLVSRGLALQWVLLQANIKL